MWTSAVLFVMLLMVLEFSFSRLFAQYTLQFMMGFKVVWVSGPSTISRRHAACPVLRPALALPAHDAVRGNRSTWSRGS